MFLGSHGGDTPSVTSMDDLDTKGLRSGARRLSVDAYRGMPQLEGFHPERLLYGAGGFDCSLGVLMA